MSLVSIQGMPRLSSLATVVVIVTDVNDNPPEFEQTVYSLSVSESASVGTKVGQVFATSRDSGVNAAITYHFINSLTTDFTIDRNTGLHFKAEFGAFCT